MIRSVANPRITELEAIIQRNQQHADTAKRFGFHLSYYLYRRRLLNAQAELWELTHNGKDDPR